MQTLSALSKKEKNFKETLEILPQLLTGFNVVYRKLEDLCFANLYPKRYKVLNEAISKARGNRREILRIAKKNT